MLGDGFTFEARRMLRAFLGDDATSAVEGARDLEPAVRRALGALPAFGPAQLVGAEVVAGRGGAPLVVGCPEPVLLSQTEDSDACFAAVALGRDPSVVGLGIDFMAERRARDVFDDEEAPELPSMFFASELACAHESGDFALSLGKLVCAKEAAFKAVGETFALAEDASRARVRVGFMNLEIACTDGEWEALPRSAMAPACEMLGIERLRLRTFDVEEGIGGVCVALQHPP